MGRKYSKQNVPAIEENNMSWYHLQSFTEATECHSKLSSALFQVTHSWSDASSYGKDHINHHQYISSSFNAEKIKGLFRNGICINMASQSTVIIALYCNAKNSYTHSL